MAKRDNGERQRKKREREREREGEMKKKRQKERKTRRETDREEERGHDGAESGDRATRGRVGVVVPPLSPAPRRYEPPRVDERQVNG